MPLPNSFRESGADSTEAWHDIRDHNDILNQRDWQQLRDAFLRIKNSDVRSAARDAVTKKVLDFMAGWDGVARLSKDIWAPFSGKSAVIAIDEAQQPRDWYPFNELSRYLPGTGFLETTFHTVSLTNPTWSKVRLNEHFAACFIGRHTMFRDCAILKVPGDLRFSLPKDDAEKRGGLLSPEFHQVLQERKNAAPLHFKATQEKGERTDYALIQRFAVTFGVRLEVVVLLIQGATSLGTFGAAKWIASRRCDDIRFPSGLRLCDSSRLEILLEVHSEVRDPPEPWEPICYPRKIFIDDAKMGMRQDTLQIAVPPEIITVGTKPKGSGGVKYVQFDGDDVRVQPPLTEIVLHALCLKALRKGRAASNKWVVGIPELIEDKSVWPDADVDFHKLNPQWFQDNLKEGLLGNSLVIGHKNKVLELTCDMVEEEAL